jgi:membrane-bound lytic murein transglycosylase MltF
MVEKNALVKKGICLWILIVISGACLPGTVLGVDILNKATRKQFLIKSDADFNNAAGTRVIRALVPYSKTFFFFDGATPRGATYDLLKLFEKQLNTKYKTRHIEIHILIIPTPRDKLISHLNRGLGEIAAGNLTITKDRLKQVDFSDPLGTGVSEILVTGPAETGITSVSDLAGKAVSIRESSSYYESLVRFNRPLPGKSKIKLVEMGESLEDEDLLEMVNAGYIPSTVVDRHKGKFWAQIFDKITLHPNISFREDASIAWAIRKNTPSLTAEVNEFVKQHKKGTLHGNILFKRYLKKATYVKDNQGGADRKRYEAAKPLFQKYANQYNFDWMLLAALAYQESGIDQSKQSRTGAIGVMQVLPSTARDRNINIPDIDTKDGNIHAGTKYLRFLIDRYFNDPKIDAINRLFLALAAYNAGPRKVADLRKEATEMGLDPTIWFKNVEVVAAKRIGRETVQYVSNIFKYYIAYCMCARPFDWSGGH